MTSTDCPRYEVRVDPDRHLVDDDGTTHATWQIVMWFASDGYGVFEDVFFSAAAAQEAVARLPLLVARPTPQI